MFCCHTIDSFLVTDGGLTAAHVTADAWRRVGLRTAIGKVGVGSPRASEFNGGGGEINGDLFIGRFNRCRM